MLVVCAGLIGGVVGFVIGSILEFESERKDKKGYKFYDYIRDDTSR